MAPKIPLELKKYVGTPYTYDRSGFRSVTRPEKGQVYLIPMGLPVRFEAFHVSSLGDAGAFSGEFLSGPQVAKGNQTLYNQPVWWPIGYTPAKNTTEQGSLFGGFKAAPVQAKPSKQMSMFGVQGRKLDIIQGFANPEKQPIKFYVVVKGKGSESIGQVFAWSHYLWQAKDEMKKMKNLAIVASREDFRRGDFIPKTATIPLPKNEPNLENTEGRSLQGSNTLHYTESHFGLVPGFDPEESFKVLKGMVEDYLDRRLNKQEIDDLKTLRNMRLYVLRHSSTGSHNDPEYAVVVPDPYDRNFSSRNAIVLSRHDQKANAERVRASASIRIIPTRKEVYFGDSLKVNMDDTSGSQKNAYAKARRDQEKKKTQVKNQARDFKAALRASGPGIYQVTNDNGSVDVYEVK